MLVSDRDSGPGIEPEKLERVFDSLFSTKFGGAGMGLSICRSIIERIMDDCGLGVQLPRGKDCKDSVLESNPNAA